MNPAVASLMNDVTGLQGRSLLGKTGQLAMDISLFLRHPRVSLRCPKDFNNTHLTELQVRETTFPGTWRVEMSWEKDEGADH